MTQQVALQQVFLQAQQHLEQGRLDQAARTIGVCIQQAPGNYSLHALALRIMLARGASDEALQRAGLLRDTLGDHHRLLMSMAEVLFYRKQYDEALVLAQQALHKRLAGDFRPRPSAPLEVQHFHKQGYEALLNQALHRLYRAGIPAFPVAGTLLGLVREGQLLPFDKDVDIGLPFDQIPKALPLLYALGWRELPNTNGLVNPRSIRHSSGLVMDLCGYCQHHDALLSGFWHAPLSVIDPHQTADTDAQQRITRYPLLDVAVRETPQGSIGWLAEPELWLAAIYGPDWQQPDPGFDSIVGAHNLNGFSPVVAFFAYSHLYQFFSQGRVAKLKATLSALEQYQPNEPVVLALKQRIRET